MYATIEDSLHSKFPYLQEKIINICDNVQSILLLLLATKSYFFFLLLIFGNLRCNVFAYNLISLLFGNSPYNVEMESHFSWVMEYFGKHLYFSDKNMHRWRFKESHLCIANTRLPLKHENIARNPKHIIYPLLKGAMFLLCVWEIYITPTMEQMVGCLLGCL